MTFEDYRKDTGINASAIKAAIAGRNWRTGEPMISMAQMRHVMTTRDKEQSAAMRLGTIIHLAILEPERTGELVVWPGKTRKEPGYQDFKKQHAGATIYLQADVDAAVACGRSVFANRDCRAILDAALDREVVARWTDEAYGAAKARADLVTRDHMVWDIKSTKSVGLFQNTSERLNYWIQAGWYVRGFNAAGFGFLVIQNEPPYECYPVRVPAEYVAQGYQEASAIARRYRECEAAGEWPGIGPQEMDMPRWAGQGEEDMSNGEMEPGEL